MGDVVRRLKGHAASVLCCAAVDGSTTLASGGEDGRLCIFYLRTNEASQTYRSFEGVPVASLCFNQAKEHFIHAAAGPSVYTFDLRMGASAKELAKYVLNTDDVNQVVVNRKGTFLASSDDSGETKILDLQNHRLFKTLRGGHTNICTSVQFHPQRPWEVLTGGLDSRVIRWDFNRARQLAVAGAGFTEVPSHQIFNPPLVHALACPQKELSGEFARVMVVACGDCSVEVYDVSAQANKGKKDVLLRKCRLDTDKGGHTASVSHVTFANFVEQSGRMIVSGGNDAKLKLWDWTLCDQSEDEVPLKLTLEHKKKVNWLTTRSCSSDNLIVADTSKRLSVYSF